MAVDAGADEIQHLDFDEPCAGEALCPDPAVWNWICGLCNFRAPICHRHRSIFDRVVADVRVAQVQCNGCKQNTRRYYRWEPRKP